MGGVTRLLLLLLGVLQAHAEQVRSRRLKVHTLGPEITVYRRENSETLYKVLTARALICHAIQSSRAAAAAAASATEAQQRLY